MRGIIGHTDEKMTDHYTTVTMDERRTAEETVLRVVTAGDDPDARKKGEVSGEGTPNAALARKEKVK